MLSRKVLVTGCGGDIGLAVGRILQEEKAADSVIGCDMQEDHAGRIFFDRCFVAERATAPNYMDSLLQIVEEEKVDLVIPTSEPELRTLYANDFFGRRDLFLTANLKAMEIGFDKYKTAEFLRENKLPYPWTRVAATEAPLEFPCILKSRTGCGSKNVQRLTEEDYNNRGPYSEDDIFQEFIAEDDEEFRKEGEPLHPERFDLERLSKIRKAVGSQAWNALYQQRPSNKGGGIIKGSWFGRYKVPPIIKVKAIYADTAQKTKQHNDYSVFIVAGKGADGKAYILDLIRGKWEAPELEQTLKDIWAKHKAKKETGILTRANVEDKASGTSLIQAIRRNNQIPITPIQVDSDKYTRVLGVQGYIESGYVMLPESAPWIADFINELEAFTATDSHAHDDQVDALVMAISDILGKPKSLLDL